MSLQDLPVEWSSLAHRVTEVPVRDDAELRTGRQRMAGALATAHAAGRPVVVSWVRARQGGPVQVLVGGAEAADGDRDVLVGFPAGARGRRQRAADVEAALGGLTWLPTQLALDPGSMVEASFADRIEDQFGLSTAASGFLVVARPLDAAEVEATIEGLSDEVVRLEALRTGRGVHRRRLARAEQALDYYDRSAGSGCWRLAVWTGAASPDRARALASVLAGSADLDESPLVLRAGGPPTSSQLDWTPSLVVGAETVAVLARPPFRELPGVRTTRLPEFDQNVEDRVELRLGSVLDGTSSPAAPFGVSLDSVNRHVFVSGATGAGKSETVRNLLWQLHQQRIPWLVIEPAKAEYAGLAPWLDVDRPVAVIRPGDPDVPPPMLNPLEPTSIEVGGVRHTFPLQTHVDMVRALFTASFDAQEPFPQVLGAALNRSYQVRGWSLATGRPTDPELAPPSYPVLGDLVHEALAVVEGLDYAGDVRGNMRGFLRVRIESLRSGTPGRFFEGGHPLDLDALLRRCAVFEIEDLGDDQDKAFFIGNLLIRVAELLRLRSQLGLLPDGLGHVLVIEEAHRLLRRVAEESPAAHAVTMFANLLAEVRAYGEGVVVAEQIPAKVIPDVVKNSAVKVMHRLPAQDDRDTVGATMNLTEAQSAHVVALEPGTAVVHSAGMDRPVLARIDRVGDRPPTGGGTTPPAVGVRAASHPDETAPLTLAELEAARALVTPEVALWVELVVVASLTNDRIGTPAGSWFRRLQQAEGRLATAALALAVHDSVARRAPLVRSWHDLTSFREAVLGLVTVQLETGRGIDRPAARWAVGQFRFAAMTRALRAPGPDDDTSRPHPSSGDWRARGVDLPGPTWADQARQLNRLAQDRTVRSAELAGSPYVLDEIARTAGVTGRSARLRIQLALESMGLEALWLGGRVGADDG